MPKEARKTKRGRQSSPDPTEEAKDLKSKRSRSRTVDAMVANVNKGQKIEKDSQKSKNIKAKNAVARKIVFNSDQENSEMTNKNINAAPMQKKKGHEKLPNDVSNSVQPGCSQQMEFNPDGIELMVETGEFGNSDDEENFHTGEMDTSDDEVELQPDGEAFQVQRGETRESVER